MALQKPSPGLLPSENYRRFGVAFDAVDANTSGLAASQDFADNLSDAINAINTSLTTLAQTVGTKASQSSLDGTNDNLTAVSNNLSANIATVQQAVSDLAGTSASNTNLNAVSQAVSQLQLSLADYASAANLTVVSTNLGINIDTERTQRIAADAAALAVTTTKLRDQLAQLSRMFTNRPGDAPRAFTASLAGGDPDLLPPLTFSPVKSDRGAVLRFTGPQIVARRGYTAIEPGRIYEVRAVVQRRADAEDPSNDAVRLAIAWYDRNLARLNGSAISVVADLNDLRAADGRVEIIARVNSPFGQGVTILPPAGALYGVPYIQIYGGLQSTDIEVLDLVESLEGTLYSPDLTGLTSRIGQQESLNAGSRLSTIEGQLTTPRGIRMRTLTDAKAATVLGSVDEIEVLGYLTPGVGGALYLRSATSGAGPGRFATQDGAWWQLAHDTSLKLEQLGAGIGNGGADAAALQAAPSLSKVARLGTALQPVGITDLASYMALTVKDDGSGKADLPGLYGKWAIPAQARDASMAHAGDLIAGLHCPVSSQCTSAVEVMLGDSISTYAANTYFRGNMLAMALEREIRAQSGNKPVTFYDRSIGGKTFNELFSDTLKRPERPPWWLADVAGTRWIDLVKIPRPTRLWVSFGNNDSFLVSINDLKTLVAIVRGWDFPCDIVLLTTLVPRANVNASFPTWNTIAEQEGRHNAAGLVRTFARYMGLGLVDMNRQMLRAVYGYDPVETFLTKQGSYTAAGNGFAGDRQCTDYKVAFNLDTAQIPADNSTPIGFNTGPGTEDVIYLTRTTGANAYNLTCYTGNNGDNWAYVINAPVTIVPDNGTQIRLCFERYGNLACLYKDGTAAEAYGEFLPHLWSGKIMARGGRYVPSLSCSKAGAILSASFDYGAPALCNPSLSVDDLYGDAFPAFYRGGSGWNHPGSLVDAHIYGPVLRNCQMFAGDALVRSFPTTMTVRGTTGQVRRFSFDDDGFTSRDGNVTANRFFRTAGGIRLDLTNLAPRITPSGQGVTVAAGSATDSAYFVFGATGVFSTANGGISGGGTIAHSADNTWSFGTPSLRATVVYAATGTINTSDAREKMDRDGTELSEGRVSPLSPAEIAWGVALGDELGVYLWRAAYAEKGADARLHVGMTVQRAIALAEEHGLDPFRYGFICHDIWDAVEPQDAVIKDIEISKDEVGQPILQPTLVRPATPGHPAGERYGFRYEELLLFIQAAERAMRKPG